MNSRITELEALAIFHGNNGSALFQACEASLFPCDALAYSVLERSLNLLKGFCLLLRNGGYTCGAALLRMQLDNVLRLHGVVTTSDPHGIANEMINGKALRKLKDSKGHCMTDKRLVEVLSITNPHVERVYKLTSSYIHLSEQHFYHFIERSKKNQRGLRDFAIGDGDEYLDEAHKIELVAAFKVVTDGVLDLVQQWISVRNQFGDKQTLAKRFSNAI